MRMIVNANPLSREKVEKGSFCLRENENGVDLNRMMPTGKKSKTIISK
jgi:hypothetical protein